MLAVKAGKDDLAREALTRKQEYDGYAASFQKEFEAQHASVEQLKDALRQLQAKIEEASRKKNLLIARAKRAEATCSASSVRIGSAGKGWRARSTIWGERCRMSQCTVIRARRLFNPLATISLAFPSATARQIARSHSIRVKSEDTTVSAFASAARMLGFAFSLSSHARTALDSA